jgi:hypothetical protein
MLLDLTFASRVRLAGSESQIRFTSVPIPKFAFTARHRSAPGAPLSEKE